jgi:hypothetical protein
MDMRVDMIDPIQRDVMMLAVRRCALGELDFVWPVQVVDGPNLDAARCNDVQVLGDLAANFTCGTGEPPSAIVLDLDFHMPNGILISWVRSAAVLRSVSSSFTRVSLPNSLFRPLLSFNDAVLE